MCIAQDTLVHAVIRIDIKSLSIHEKRDTSKTKSSTHERHAFFIIIFLFSFPPAFALKLGLANRAFSMPWCGYERT